MTNGIIFAFDITKQESFKDVVSIYESNNSNL